MIQHFSKMRQQIKADGITWFKAFTSNKNNRPTAVEFHYANFRLAAAGTMVITATQTLTGLLFTLSLSAVAIGVATFILAHDIFQILKNRQQLENNPLSLETFTTVGKGIFSGGKALFKSIWEGKSDQEIAKDTFHAAFKEAASLQSKNTILKPLWDKIQFEMAIRNHNPFPKKLFSI